MNRNEQLQSQVERQVKRIHKAKKERHNLISQTVYLGTLGLLFILPVVGGLYLGLWLDGQMEGYSSRWTLGLLFLGIIIGALNIYLFIRE